MSEDPTRGHGFDELARSLAEGSITRRRALKLFAGTAIAALIPSRAMAITCPSGTVKICVVPGSPGDCMRSQAHTECVSPTEAARLRAENPCTCCGGCGGTDDCREPKPPTCFPTTTSTSTSTTSTTTTAACKQLGTPCVRNVDQCCGNLVCRGGTQNPDRFLCRRPL